jgi:hypothetical protein
MQAERGSTVNIEEAITLRSVTEQEISEFIKVKVNQFEIKTGLAVASVDIRTLQQQQIGNLRASLHIEGVRLTVKL